MMSPAIRASRPKVGLALGSGGSRGIVHLEVLDGLRRMGIPLDILVGSSIGAVAAGLYAVGALPRVREDLRTFKREDFLRMFDPSLSRYGFFSGRKILVFLKRYIPAETRIEDLSVRLGIVATDYDSGRPVVFRRGNLLQAIRASISIPGVFTPVRIGRKLLLDGGVVSPLPIDIAEEMGAHLVAAVSLQPSIGQLRRILPLGLKKPKAGPGEESGSLQLVEKVVRRLSSARNEESGWLHIADQWLTAKRSEAEDRKKLPNLIDIVTRTIDIMAYTETLQMLAAHPPAVLFEFDFPDLGTLDFTRSEELLAAGRRLLERKEPEIRAKILDRLTLPVPPDSGF
ncbi:MAG: patatin-like phospholipase family protein [Candidatus Aminicenantes bacterium]|nr:patatin-like phospholipase family protein [Candidatus Aminicenantes bacterium]